MGTIDVEALLRPISESAPAGEDLEYDAGFAEMEQASMGKPEQQYGDTIIPPEEPDWKQVKRLALDLLKRSRDFRIAVYYARATLVVDSISEFAEALTLITGYVRDFWESAHPQLDPDDDNDPTIRINTIGTLNDFGSTIHLLRQTPIIRSRRMGRYSFRDVEIAAGELAPPPDMEHKPDMASIDAAAMDCELADLRSEREAVQRALSEARNLTSQVTMQVGAADTVSLKDLEAQLKHIDAFLTDKLAKRGDSGNAAPEEEAATGEAPPAGGGNGSVSAEIRPAVPRISGEITTREDVIRALDKICSYYERFEPSSPVPLLLKRAKRLATMSFLDILRDLTPDGVNQAIAIGGMGIASSNGGDSAESGSRPRVATHSDLDDL